MPEKKQLGLQQRTRPQDMKKASQTGTMVVDYKRLAYDKRKRIVIRLTLTDFGHKRSVKYCYMQTPISLSKE